MATAARLEVGLGAAEALRRPGTGVVLSCHRDGVWLRLPGGICGLASMTAVPGPLWTRGPFPRHELRPGRPVVVAAGRGDLLVGGTALGLSGPAVVIWRGALPHHDLVEAIPARRLAVDVLGAARPSAVLEGPLADAAGRAAAAVAAGDLGAAAALLGGLGPGLTPAGDDVLAGLWLAARARSGPWAEAGLLAVAASVATTDLSAAFLRWAARGQHAAPAHDLLTAAARGDEPGAAAAVARLGRFGSSSGSDVAYGLRLGLDLLPPRPHGGFLSDFVGLGRNVGTRGEFLLRGRCRSGERI